MINDTTIIEFETIDIGPRSLLVERRRGLVGDHIVDISARAYAVRIRLEGADSAKAQPVITHERSKSLVKVAQ